MKKRYIVCVNNSTQEQDKFFIEFIQTNGFGWWHWFSNVWLLSDSRGKLNASKIRDNVRRIFNDEYNLVIEINSEKDTWSGFGPQSEEENMFKWIKTNWKK